MTLLAMDGMADIKATMEILPLLLIVIVGAIFVICSAIVIAFKCVTRGVEKWIALWKSQF